LSELLKTPKKIVKNINIKKNLKLKFSFKSFKKLYFLKNKIRNKKNGINVLDGSIGNKPIRNK